MAAWSQVTHFIPADVMRQLARRCDALYVAPMIAEAQAAARAALAGPGDWLTGPQRLDVWAQTRDAATNQLDGERRDALSPSAVPGTHSATAELSQAAVEVAHRVASDPGRLTRKWADEQIAQLGAATYTEVVGVTAIAKVIDKFDLATGCGLRPLPEPSPGKPAQQIPDDVGDVGAWVPQTLGPSRANVSRTLSGTPKTNDAWRPLVDSHYSRGAEFMRLEWDRALTRPQIELVAARVTALSECFY